MVDSPYTEDAPLARSGLVSGVAWLFILLAGFGVVVGLAQALAMLFWPPLVDVLDQYRDTAAQQGEAAQLSGFVLENLTWMVLSNLLISMLVLIAAVGLLKRFNWARWLFIVMLVLLILWGLGTTVALWQAVPYASTGAAAAYDPALAGASAPTLWLGSGLMLLLCAALGWLIWRLCSARVRAEFH